MLLPEECWVHIHTFLYLKEFCWPSYVHPKLRAYASFKVRRARAGPLHSLFHNLYGHCVIEWCTASRGAFRHFVVSPYCVRHACQWSCPRTLYFRAPLLLGQTFV